MFEKLFWSAKEEGAGIFGFANLSNFWFGTHAYQLCFPVLVFCLVCGFSPTCFSFSIFVNNNAGFSDFYVQCTTSSGFAKEVTLRLR